MPLCLVALLLVAIQPGALIDSNQAEEICDTRNTTKGECCAFPFTYQGETYYECTTKDFNGKQWCSLNEDFEKHRRWGHCANQTRKPVFDVILDVTGQDGRSRDNIELFQGDIVMTSQIRNNLRNRGILVPNNDPRSPLSRCGRKKPLKRPKRAIMSTNRGSDLRWPIGESGKREVPYEITGTNNNVRGVILRAMDHWMDKVPCLKFVSITSRHSRHLSFFRGGGCYSMVGRQPGSGPQKISIGTGCGYLGVVVHEIGHALGFWHEQSRPDRDNYVTINWSNIRRGMAYNFHKYDTTRVDSRGVSYDYDSVMHYSSTAFANRAGVRTIVGKNGRTNLGQRYGLSKKDIQQANLLYSCGTRPPVTAVPPKPPTPPPPGCGKIDRYAWCPYWKSKGHCRTGSRYFDFMGKHCQKSCKCVTPVPCKNKHKNCVPWARSGYCHSYKAYMDQFCKQSCGKC
ncbi:nematocyst expressed protein 6-like isoform X1 [Acropora muricata]|uniref:nematocyst expressed protein 6-like isoform X1 n=1 Tax=Acropora muricata TaxID=159855 RepID=UPI0034E3A9A7